MWVRMTLEGHPTEPQDLESGQKLVDNGKAEACDPPAGTPAVIEDEVLMPPLDEIETNETDEEEE
ncbi:MAG: hypothetical protein GY847_14225 [Proteobacteria bacterium]|nr:hypothetical protein [Pseudomonadota bacterium]